MRFDVCANTYDEHAGPQMFFAERVNQFIGAKPGEIIIELGAGTGALTRHLIGAPGTVPADHVRAGAAPGASLFATDASPTMVGRGRLAVPEAQWSVLNAFSQPFPVASLQVSSGLLHWANDPVAALVRWRASLSLGGRMVHAMPCEPCLAEWRELVPENPVPWRSEAEWLAAFEGAGLHVTRSQRWMHSAVCASALEMVRGFHRTGVTGRVRVGPAKLRQALREYDARHRVPGGVRTTWAWLAVEAVGGEQSEAPHVVSCQRIP